MLDLNYFSKEIPYWNTIDYLILSLTGKWKDIEQMKSPRSSIFDQW